MYCKKIKINKRTNFTNSLMLSAKNTSVEIADWCKIFYLKNCLSLLSMTGLDIFEVVYFELL